MSRKKREQKDRAWLWRVGQVAAYAAVKSSSSCWVTGASEPGPPSYAEVGPSSLAIVRRCPSLASQRLADGTGCAGPAGPTAHCFLP